MLKQAFMMTVSESFQIHQHELHKKVIKKSLITELHTEDGVISGHKECADILANSVKSFLCDESPLDINDQDTSVPPYLTSDHFKDS